MRKLKKKGVLGLQSVVMGLVVLGFTLIIGFAMMEKASDTQTTNSFAKNASIVTLQAMDDIPTWLGVIVIALVAVGLFMLIKRLNA